MKRNLLPVALATTIMFLIQVVIATATTQVDANGNALPPAESPAGSEDEAAELAKKLQNPVASLISVPFQNNFDFNMGPNDDGFKYTLNFQRLSRCR